MLKSTLNSVLANKVMVHKFNEINYFENLIKFGIA